MKINDLGLHCIKYFEQLRLKRYNDAAGLPTIGWGHLIKGGERYDVITKEQADNLLKKDVEIAERGVSQSVSVELNPNQFSSLVSFVYNVGTGAFLNSTLREKLNKGDYEGASNEFERWVHAGGKKLNGLIKRRALERFIFTLPHA